MEGLNTGSLPEESWRSTSARLRVMELPCSAAGAFPRLRHSTTLELGTVIQEVPTQYNQAISCA